MSTALDTESIQLHPGDPFLLIPPKYRNKACFGPSDLQEILDIGRKEYTRLQVSGELPPPLNIRSKGQRWSIAAIAAFLAGHKTETTPKSN